MTDDQRSIDIQLEVPGTPEQVWEAIATGPGITSWYVPHEVEPRAGGAMTASFGPGPEMQVRGRVAAWEPPTRVVFDGGEGAAGLAFEWHVEGRDGGMSIVRLVNTGFGSGEEWDAQYDAMTEGWRAFFVNLRLHLTHFAGRQARSAMPMAMWPQASGAGWPRLAAALGVDPDAAPGDRIVVSAAGAPRLAGTVTDRLSVGVAVLLEEPAPGTAMLLAEAHGPVLGVSTWCYLYGDDAARLATEVGDRWSTWLQSQAAGAESTVEP